MEAPELLDLSKEELGCSSLYSLATDFSEPSSDCASPVSRADAAQLELEGGGWEGGGGGGGGGEGGGGGGEEHVLESMGESRPDARGGGILGDGEAKEGKVCGETAEGPEGKGGRGRRGEADAASYEGGDASGEGEEERGGERGSKGNDGSAALLKETGAEETGKSESAVLPKRGRTAPEQQVMESVIRNEAEHGQDRLASIMHSFDAAVRYVR